MEEGHKKIVDPFYVLAYIEQVNNCGFVQSPLNTMQIKAFKSAHFGCALGIM